MSDGRLSRGRSEGGAQFPTPPALGTVPDWYPELLAAVSTRVAVGQQRAIAAECSPPATDSPHSVHHQLLANLSNAPTAVTETSSKGPLRVRSQVANWIQGWERRAGRPPIPPSNRPTTLANYPGQLTPGPGMEYLPAEIDELTRDRLNQEYAAGQYRDDDGH